MRSDDKVIIQARRRIIPLGVIETPTDLLLQQIREKRIDDWKGTSPKKVLLVPHIRFSGDLHQ
jgi:hypothetical protein